MKIEDLEDSLSRALSWARSEEFSGYSKFDALNSPYIARLVGERCWPAVVSSQIVNRTPLPLREVLGVERSRNPKGIANFIRAMSLVEKNTKGIVDRKELLSLGSWLWEARSQVKSEKFSKYKGAAWGYNFPWASPAFFAQRHSPNAIVTTFCGSSLLRLFETVDDPLYLDRAKAAATFLLNELPIMEESEQAKCISYVPSGSELKVVNINSVVAEFLIELFSVTGEVHYREEARKLLTWVASVVTEGGCWTYTYPETRYVKGYDNYHTGGILDGFLAYRTATCSCEFDIIYFEGLQLYASELFEASGAPRWRSHTLYPLDIHGAAQGIISFSRAAQLNNDYLHVAEQIASWAISNMQDDDGKFYYQKNRFYTWKISFMRWCNSWMARALAELIVAKRKVGAH